MGPKAHYELPIPNPTSCTPHNENLYWHILQGLVWLLSSQKVVWAGHLTLQPFLNCFVLSLEINFRNSGFAGPWLSMVGSQSNLQAEAAPGLLLFSRVVIVFYLAQGYWEYPFSAAVHDPTRSRNILAEGLKGKGYDNLKVLLFCWEAIRINSWMGPLYSNRILAGSVLSVWFCNRYMLKWGTCNQLHLQLHSCLKGWSSGSTKGGVTLQTVWNLTQYHSALPDRILSCYNREGKWEDLSCQALKQMPWNDFLHVWIPRQNLEWRQWSAILCATKSSQPSAMSNTTVLTITK